MHDWHTEVRARLAALRLRPEREADIVDEIAQHLAERYREATAAGASPDEATRLALAEFKPGNALAQRIAALKQAHAPASVTLGASTGHLLDDFRQDLRYAARSFTKQPGFAATVVMTLAAAIGAASATFSVIDSVLLRPLPFPEPDRLVQISHARTAGATISIPPIRLRDWLERSSSFDGLATYYTEDVTDTTGDRPESVRRATVTPGFFDLWRIAPAMGSAFSDEEQRLGGPRAALVSDRYWRDHMGADPEAIGKVILIDGQSVEVVGVMPPSFAQVDRAVAVWTPAFVSMPWPEQRTNGWFSSVIGRLAPGVTLEQARADVTAVQRQLAAEYPQTDADLIVAAVPRKDVIVGPISGSLWLLFGAVSLLLLITCANIAALLLARATQRERDVAIRFSLGASRARVVFQLMTETGLLVVVGTAAGLALAYGAVTALGRAAFSLPRFDEVVVDGRVVLFSAAATVVVTLLCGLVPAFRHTRASSGRAHVSSRQSANWSLVGVQVALSVALLAGAGLLLRSFDAVARIDLGFDAERVLTFRLSGSFSETRNYPGVVQRINRTIEELEALPGIENVGTSFAIPGVGAGFEEEVPLADASSAAEPRVVSETRTVSPSYFATLGIPLVAGEICRQADMVTRDAVVNRAFVERYFPQRSVLGLPLAGNTPGRITGIVGDVRELNTLLPPVPVVYFCNSAPTPFPQFFVRTNGEPMAAAAAVRARLNELEPLRSLYDIAPLDQRIGDVHAVNRLRTWLLTAFATTSLALTCLGVYGTLSYVVSLRRREVGLRVALGAASGRIVAQFVGKVLRVVTIACVAGLALSYVFARALSGMLYGVAPSDPVTLITVVVLVVAVAGAAALFPAIRATRVPPMVVLRDE
jgi:predicted permease